MRGRSLRVQPLGSEVVLGADDEAAVAVAEADGLAQPGVVVGGRDDHLELAERSGPGGRGGLVFAAGLVVICWWLVRWRFVGSGVSHAGKRRESLARSS